MRAIKVLNETLYFAKENFNNAITVAGEGFVIQLVMQFVMVPFIFLIMFIFPLLMAGGFDPEVASILFMGAYLGFALIGALLQTFAISIMLGGEVYSLDRIKKKRKVKFGEVFKYGWKHKFPLMGIFLINMVLFVVLFTLPLVVIVVLMSYFAYLSYFMFIMLLTSLMVMMFAIIPIQLTLLPLPFVIRNRLGTGVVGSVLEAWKFYFKHFPSLYVIGLFFSMAVIVLSFIPLVSIFVRLSMYPAVIISELILLDDVLGVQRFRPRYVDQNQLYTRMKQDQAAMVDGTYYEHVDPKP